MLLGFVPGCLSRVFVLLCLAENMVVSWRIWDGQEQEYNSVLSLRVLCHSKPVVRIVWMTITVSNRAGHG